jgi:hypothetical protein
MSIALYAIADDYRKALDSFADDLATEDDANALLALLGEVEERFENKAAAVVAYSRNLQAEADAFAAEATRMMERSRQISRKSDALKDYLAAEMSRMGLDECKAGLASLKFREGAWSVEIEDMGALPEEYIRRKPAPDPEANKVEISKALKEGKQIPGARLIQGQRKLVIK